MAVNLPRLQRTVPLVDEYGRPHPSFHLWWQNVAKQLEDQLNSINATLNSQIATAQSTATTAQSTATAAGTSATTAQTAATAAGTSATAAQTAATAAAKELARINSYTVPTAILTANASGGTAFISIANHTRIYPVEGSIAVASVSLASIPNITGLAFSTTYFVYYDDTTLASTTPTMHTTTDAKQAAVGFAAGRHYVGSITTPAHFSSDTSGSSGSGPGGTGPFS